MENKLNFTNEPEKNKKEWLHILSKNWFLVFSISYGLYVGVPFIAPVLMKLGLEFPANFIYKIYSLLCHQMPQRSFFLFGTKSMYSLAEIQQVWGNSSHPMILRKFIGNPEMGWKVAWSDRMVSLYTSILFVSWLWYPFRRKIGNLPLWGLASLALPMIIDGLTHLVSDFAGIGQGFRDTNLWLAKLTNFTYLHTFYAGDALGSFNSWMRFISGTLFGVGIVLLAFPLLDETFKSIENKFNDKYESLNKLTEESINEIFGKNLIDNTH